MSLISRNILNEFFPSTTIKPLMRTNIIGVESGGNTASEYAAIPLKLMSVKETVTLSAKVHNIEEPSYSLLIGMNVLKDDSNGDLNLSKDNMRI
jgi:hypothetical protein